MSFGVSVSDIITVISLAKDTVQYCRHAPNDFAEASRVSQSLYLMLEGVKTEYQNSDSPLHKDDRTRTDFAIHFKNCETSLKPLTELIVKHKRLATSSIRIIDRARFPKKDYLEYRGNLAFYTARLSEFLQMVGLGSLGRIEQKIEDIKGDLPNLMSKLDQMCAEFRIMGDRESLLSDHSDDEKFVWKTFRSKLNEVGFTSKVLREHEAAIFLRIRELTQCGLLDTDGSSSLRISDESLSSQPPVYQTLLPSIPPRAPVENDADSEKKISPKQTVKDLRSRKSNGSGRVLYGETLNLNRPKQKSDSREDFIRETSSSLVHDNARYDNVPPAGIRSFLKKPRIWRNPNGDVILKVDSDKQEVLVPQSNLSEADVAYVDCAIECAPEENKQMRARKYEPLPKDLACPKKASDVDDFEDEPISLPRRARPDTLIGQRTQTKIEWAYREEGSKLPNIAPYCSRSSLTNDLLPTAASSGDLRYVKKLLALGERIESKGPQSWTETIHGQHGTTTQRHTYPETTALYRAAFAGWFDVVHFLIAQGANVNTRDCYDGIPGDPILFSVIRHGHVKIARLLIEYEAKIEPKSIRTTALHVASSCPRRALVQLMLDYGANVDAKDFLSQTPLYLASAGGFASIVELLLEEGARPNVITSEGRTALYKSCENGRDDLVELLLRYGADPSVGHGRLGETTIYKAAWYNGSEVVDLLLNFEADVNIRNKKKMQSYKGVSEKIFHGIVSGLSNEHAILNAWGKAPLHAAAYRGHVDMVQMLLSAGADIEAAGNDGMTPVYLAAQQKHEEVVQILLKAGAQLQTEKHDPVIALLDERNKAKDGRGKELVKKDDHRKEMVKMGISDPLVGLVADLTKSWSSSRRLRDNR